VQVEEFSRVARFLSVYGIGTASRIIYYPGWLTTISILQRMERFQLTKTAWSLPTFPRPMTKHWQHLSVSLERPYKKISENSVLAFAFVTRLDRS
jgi:hypothetical protein